MKRIIYMLLVLCLTMGLLLGLGTVAFAESEGPIVSKSLAALQLAPYSFPSDQCYEYADDCATYFTVQLAASCTMDGATAKANAMVAKGFDGFVYVKDGVIYVMAGKFSDPYEALCYGELIHTDPEEYGAYMTNVELPVSAGNSFQTVFFKHTEVSQCASEMESFWENPTGAYFRADAEDAVEVYAVQFSKGTCFARSESLRDQMELAGYPAFVVKENMTYRTLTGMFFDRDEAKEYCSQIRCNTREGDAVVKSALVPAEEVDSFLAWWNEQ